MARHPKFLWITAGLFAGLMFSAAAPATATERFTFEERAVAIHNLVGEVKIVETDGPMFVEIEREGRDAADLEIRRGHHQDRQTLQVVYPGNRVRSPFPNSRTTIHVDREGRFSRGRGWSGDRRITIEPRRGLDARAHLRIGVPHGADLAVYLGVGTMEATSVEADLNLDVACADVMTAQTKGNLVIDTGSGSVAVKDARGPLSVDTGSGDVFVGSVTSDRVHVDTGSGGVIVQDAAAERLLVDTGSGSVRLTGLESAEVSVDTGSGRVELEFLSDVRSLRVDTGSGDVVMRVPSELGAEFRLDTGSGRIRVETPTARLHRSRGSARGVLGDGDGWIAIETGSGSVTIR